MTSQGFLRADVETGPRTPLLSEHDRLNQAEQEDPPLAAEQNKENKEPPTQGSIRKWLWPFQSAEQIQQAKQKEAIDWNHSMSETIDTLPEGLWPWEPSLRSSYLVAGTTRELKQLLSELVPQKLLDNWSEDTFQQLLKLGLDRRSRLLKAVYEAEIPSFMYTGDTYLRLVSIPDKAVEGVLAQHWGLLRILDVWGSETVTQLHFRRGLCRVAARQSEMLEQAEDTETSARGVWKRCIEMRLLHTQPSLNWVF